MLFNKHLPEGKIKDTQQFKIKFQGAVVTYWSCHHNSGCKEFHCCTTDLCNARTPEEEERYESTPEFNGTIVASATDSNTSISLYYTTTAGTLDNLTKKKITLKKNELEFFSHNDYA